MYSVRKLQSSEILKTVTLQSGISVHEVAPVSTTWAVVDEEGNVVSTVNKIGKTNYEMYATKKVALMVAEGYNSNE